MPTLTSSGIGSGLDVNAIVAQLVALERRPLEQLARRESGLRAELSSYGRIKGALGAFQSAMAELKSAAKFRVHAVRVQDEAVFQASAQAGATPGHYLIEVVQLAQAHRLRSARFADRDATPIGQPGDRMRIEVGANAFEVEIGGKTLAEMRSAINAAAHNAGVTATLVPDWDGGTEHYRLVLASKETGTAHALTLSFRDGAGQAIADPLGFSEAAAARDAELRIDGALVVRGSNTISDALEGITLRLHATSGGVAKRLEVARDADAIVANATRFAEAWNALVKALRETRNGESGARGVAQGLEAELRGVLATAPSGLATGLRYLAETGLGLRSDGSLRLDADFFRRVLAADPQGVAELYAHAEQGYAARLEARARDLLGATGALGAREDAVQQRLREVAQQRARIERRVEAEEKRLRAQYAALDGLLGRLRSTSDYLAVQLARL